METISSSGMVSQVFLRCVEDCFEPIMLTDRTGRLNYVNPAWVSTYGYRREEALGQTPRLLRSEGQGDDFYKSMWKSILDPNIGFWRGEILNRAKDGHLVPVLLTITPHRNSQGEIEGYMGIAVDLSEQKSMQQQILRQDRLASIGMLAGGLAHEIGNPLGVIRGRTELVMSQIQGNEGAVKNLELIVGQIDRIAGLIQSLLQVGRGPAQILLREVDLKSSLDEVFSLMRQACRDAGVELRPGPVGFRVIGEPSHVQQLFLNLIINALHAIEDQKGKETTPQNHFIEISAATIHADSCRVSVRDSGCGISEENLNKVFQPFFTTKAAGKGTGLGLAIVTKLVDEMGAKVNVQSEGPGTGATFHIEFRTRK